MSASTNSCQRKTENGMRDRGILGTITYQSPHILIDSLSKEVYILIPN
jgi:hypothetical protein